MRSGRSARGKCQRRTAAFVCRGDDSPVAPTASERCRHDKLAPCAQKGGGLLAVEKSLEVLIANCSVDLILVHGFQRRIDADARIPNRRRECLTFPGSSRQSSSMSFRTLRSARTPARRGQFGPPRLPREACRLTPLTIYLGAFVAKQFGSFRPMPDVRQCQRTLF